MDDKELIIFCEKILKEPIEEIKPVTGGDINLAFRVETKGGIYFCKTNMSGIGEDLIHKEKLGLQLLGRHASVPKIIGHEDRFLILAWINSSKKNKRFWQALAVELASLHKITSNKFGCDHENFIGSLPQVNALKDTWSEFYISERLEPQLRMAVDNGYLSSAEVSSPELMEKIVNMVCPKEAASLIHGDLWSGNILCDENDKAFFIDPSVSYGHREMDLAMSMLFGKFDAVFYDAYEEQIPLEKDYKNRLDIYQLYYLLAHLNLFGIGYKNDVLKILKRYFQ